MLGPNFRPWGPLHWVLTKLPTCRWSVLGCISTEERSVVLWEQMHGLHSLGRSLFVRILSERSRFSTEIETMVTNRLVRFGLVGMPSEGVRQMPLFALDEAIVSCIDEFIGIAEPHVIADITAFPKRFFFPFVHRLLSSPKVKTLIVTYSSPERYFDGPLAEDHKSLAPLPLFRAQKVLEPKTELAIIGVGFMPLGLADFLEKYKHQVDVKALFPFPPGPPGYQRNWRFMNALRKDYPQAVKDPIRVEGHDVSDIFDYIVSLTDRGKRKCEFGPFGPKPMSLAMCLFARLTRSVVRYTQPTIYNPHYSSGIRIVDGVPAVHAYCIRVDGRDLYTV